MVTGHWIVGQVQRLSLWVWDDPMRSGLVTDEPIING